MNRLLVALPLYLSVPAQWLVNFIRVDKTPVVDYVATRKLYLAKAMQTMVEESLHHDDWDRLVVWEADMIPPTDALTRIAAYPDTLDIVGAMYFQHAKPHNPIVFEQETEDVFRALAPNQVTHMMDTPGLYPVDAVGMGFTSIHRRVLQTWNPDTPMWGGEHVLGHDMWFCRAATRQQFTVHVDSGIHCTHLTEVGISYEDTKQ